MSIKNKNEKKKHADTQGILLAAACITIVGFDLGYEFEFEFEFGVPPTTINSCCGIHLPADRRRIAINNNRCIDLSY